jgi:hypothetical protein
MSLTDDLSQHLEKLNATIMEIDTILIDYSKSGTMDPEEVAKAVFDIYDAKAGIATVYEMSSFILGKAMDEMPEIDLGDGRRVEKKIASDRRSWKHADLAAELARRIMMTNVDIDTGETQKSTEELITELLRFVQPSYWRVKELASIGINADNFCEVLEPKTSIIVRKPKS